jgi:hypothetical protein
MLVSSIGRFDFESENLRVKITSSETDITIVGVIREIITHHSSEEASASSSTSDTHEIIVCPTRGPVMNSVPLPSASSDGSDTSTSSEATSSSFQFTPVWVLYDPGAYGIQAMTRVNVGSLLTSSPIPGFAMAQNTAGDDADSATSGGVHEHRIIYYSHTIGRAVSSCFPYVNLRECMAKGELNVQPDYLEFKVQDDLVREPVIHNIYGQFENNRYVGKTLKAALIRAIVG